MKEKEVRKKNIVVTDLRGVNYDCIPSASYFFLYLSYTWPKFHKGKLNVPFLSIKGHIQERQRRHGSVWRKLHSLGWGRKNIVFILLF